MSRRCRWLLLFAALFGALLAGYVYLLDLVLASIGGKPLPMQAIVVAGVSGYVSHLVLDLFNTVPIALLYPLPLRVRAGVFINEQRGFAKGDGAEVFHRP